MKINKNHWGFFDLSKVWNHITSTRNNDIGLTQQNF